ncbi:MULTISPECIES: hypothetical protein [unclassified Pseudomonas]|uniref:hypothetical protein n=1 Tax=unclassified Pseudomonas TaxID=196821 RepID=UPI0011EE61F4|nr:MULTISPECIES: hypothetical protein [unclassified Pseudomonas]KAA0945250.1 hypothetical protein FQ182_18615 [Pseudomonas sp. ANT_H4]KAA0949966.1 hypothetical protein FQ186_21715 [Pseudomonas sp. ANT_H14]
MLMKLSPKKKRSARNFYWSIGAVVVIVIIGRFVSFNGQKKEVEYLTQLTAYFDNLTRTTLPKQVDAATTLESIQLVYGYTLFYRYRVNFAADSLGAAQKAQGQQELQQKLEALACGEPELISNMRKHKIYQEHSYQDAQGNTAFKVYIRPTELKCPNQ